MKTWILYLASLLLIVGCVKEPVPSGGSYEPTVEYISDLSGTTWVITRYDVFDNSTPIFPNDTLHFTSDVTYTINGSASKDYWLDDYWGEYYLTLEECTTLGGKYRGSFNYTAIEDGEINNAVFEQIGGDHDVILWMEKL